MSGCTCGDGQSEYVQDSAHVRQDDRYTSQLIDHGIRLAQHTALEDMEHARGSRDLLILHCCHLFCCFFFFFQAEDGIRDLTVTGVQTCALPISLPDGAPLLREWPAPQLDVSGEAADRWRQANGLGTGPAVALAPGSVGASKRWTYYQIGRASCRERV